ncbi:hypothetical protein ADUPG1_012046 [Aduncisulcus paluster]|uniref:D-isomer specific 2-hydroxyacid dehydrogenase NAD-binding domain-containing protein n=1 Tax=Aduncisulcus paluster TaxID=2918883 RepID=A0ABQ5JY35_9EUKA|nr:hypothetical protein ADUPG1_012046 [Aduncisulcus paluster]
MTKHLQILIAGGGDYDISTIFAAFKKKMESMKSEEFETCSVDWVSEKKYKGFVLIIIGGRNLDVIPSTIDVQLVISMSAGVDHILTGNPHLKCLASVPLIRLKDPTMAQHMAENVLIHTLRYKHKHNVFAQYQQMGLWKPHYGTRKTVVGVLGCGFLGSKIVEFLTPHVDEICVFSKSGKNPLQKHKCMEEFLKYINVLIIIVPLTPETEGIIGHRELSLLPPGSCVINVSRGKILDIDALVSHLSDEIFVSPESLKAGKNIGCAFLDVFPKEPIEKDDPIWKLPNLFITPHVSGVSSFSSLLETVATEIQCFIKNGTSESLVDKEKGY